MSTKGLRSFRPAFHFTPPKMWINDPNGLVFVDGIYHLFYQFHPEDTVWGPMHWGHATSTDLTSWTHHPIALYPDHPLGYIFSGSAVLDKDNTSGFGSIENPAIVAMFTHHGDSQQQSIAYSTDGMGFTKYEGNPVIANTELRDFRDPKIFSDKDGWHMVLAAGDHVSFYRSDNLKDWTESGTFYSNHIDQSCIWECPDLITFNVDGKDISVLLMSTNVGDDNGGARTFYFIGDFDGDTFVADESSAQAIPLDQGFDNYAGVTWSNTPDTIFIGWAVNAQYAAVTPTSDYCGMMSCARKLTLINTPVGLRLAASPILPKFSVSTTLSDGDSITAESCVFSIKGKGDCSVILRNDKGQHLYVAIDDNNLVFDRRCAGANDFSELFASERYGRTIVNRSTTGEYDITLSLDVSIAELFMDDGVIAMTGAIYPDEPYNKISISGDISVTLHSHK